jgi:hypothetical protein
MKPGAGNRTFFGWAVAGKLQIFPFCQRSEVIRPALNKIIVER